MTAKIIVLLLVILILVTVIYLFCDSGILQGIKKFPDNIREWMEENTEAKEVFLVNAPMLYYRRKDDFKYHSVEVAKDVFRIGRSSNNELVFDNKTVEERHAVVRQQYKEGQIYYELINYGKVNPVVYYNREMDKLEYLALKEGVELQDHDEFYIGNIKLRIYIPQKYSDVAETRPVDTLPSAETRIK